MRNGDLPAFPTREALLAYALHRIGYRWDLDGLCAVPEAVSLRNNSCLVSCLISMWHRLQFQVPTPGPSIIRGSRCLQLGVDLPRAPRWRTWRVRGVSASLSENSGSQDVETACAIDQS
jgi:hypothetical protein